MIFTMTAKFSCLNEWMKMEMSSNNREHPIGPVIYYDLELENVEPQEDHVFSCLRDYDCVCTDCGRAAVLSRFRNGTQQPKPDSKSIDSF